jgi:hypothetical protein
MEAADNFSYVIPVDDRLHTDEAPFCPISSCPCHEDDVEIARVSQHIQDGLLTPEEATDLVGGKLI